MGALLLGRPLRLTAGGIHKIPIPAPFGTGTWKVSKVLKKDIGRLDYGIVDIIQIILSL